MELCLRHLVRGGKMDQHVSFEPIPVLDHEKWVESGWPTNWKRVTTYNL